MNACWGLKMPPTAKSVLMSLADQANDAGDAWPSIDTIAERTCWNRATVIEAIKWLESAKAIQANRDNGRRTTYQLTPELFDPNVPATSRRATSRAERPVPAIDQSGKATGESARPVGQDDLTSRAERPHPSGKTTQPVGQNDTIPKEPSINPQEPKPRAKKTDDALPEGFAEFWDAYPRKDSKRDAIKAWGQLSLAINSELRADVMAGLAGWRKHPTWIKGERQYIKLPAGWLREERWRDESAQSARGGIDTARWWLPAGFPNIHEAENAQCFEHNAHEFRDGKRLTVQRQEVLA